MEVLDPGAAEGAREEAGDGSLTGPVYGATPMASPLQWLGEDLVVTMGPGVAARTRPHTPPEDLGPVASTIRSADPGHLWLATAEPGPATDVVRLRAGSDERVAHRLGYGSWVALGVPDGRLVGLDAAGRSWQVRDADGTVRDLGVGGTSVAAVVLVDHTGPGLPPVALPALQGAWSVAWLSPDRMVHTRPAGDGDGADHDVLFVADLSGLRPATSAVATLHGAWSWEVRPSAGTC